MSNPITNKNKNKGKDQDANKGNINKDDDPVRTPGSEATAGTPGSSVSIPLDKLNILVPGSVPIPVPMEEDHNPEIEAKIQADKAFEDKIQADKAVEAKIQADKAKAQSQAMAQAMVQAKAMALAKAMAQNRASQPIDHDLAKKVVRQKQIDDKYNKKMAEIMKGKDDRLKTSELTKMLIDKEVEEESYDGDMEDYGQEQDDIVEAVPEVQNFQGQTFEEWLFSFGKNIPDVIGTPFSAEEQCKVLDIQVGNMESFLKDIIDYGKKTKVHCKEADISLPDKGTLAGQFRLMTKANVDAVALTKSMEKIIGEFMKMVTMTVEVMKTNYQLSSYDSIVAVGETTKYNLKLKKKKERENSKKVKAQMEKEAQDAIIKEREKVIKSLPGSFGDIYRVPAPRKGVISRRGS